jgi:hypothetical protein
MNEQMKAGADIHAGGGYEEGTKEGYEAFLKVRNKSLAERRIKELAEQAEKWISTTNFEGMPEDDMTYEEIYNKKFAELLVRECAKIVEDSAWNLPHGYKAVDQASLVKQHFGVE